MNHVATLHAIYEAFGQGDVPAILEHLAGKLPEALEIHLWTFGADGRVVRFFHCIDRHVAVLAYTALKLEVPRLSGRRIDADRTGGTRSRRG
jgi:hypothetical protein